MREICANYGRVCAYLVSLGKVVTSSIHPFVDWRICKFGYFTLIGATVQIAMSCSESAFS